MKTIILNKGTLELPETWDELTFKQKLFAFARLKEMTEKKISPPMFRILVLQNLTGYRPSSGFYTWLLQWILYYFRIPFVYLYYLLTLGRIRLSGYWAVWKEYHRPERMDRDIINYNLYRLSELLDFAFTIEDYKVTWNRHFKKNPFPYLKIQGRKFTGRKFIQDVAPFTNITAKEYCDCCELYSGYTGSEDAVYREKCVDKIISILYPCNEDYKENLVGDQMDLIASIAPEVKFGILFWFAGIIEFYTTHPVYSILFKANNVSEEKDKISIGMNETILMIKKKGYPSIAGDTVNDFFDAQIKILKDYFSEAIAGGAKVEDLAARTGYSIDIINRLS
jgi:hypothetical protein